LESGGSSSKSESSGKVQVQWFYGILKLARRLLIFNRGYDLIPSLLAGAKISFAIGSFCLL
jgi:hypothetical protein